MSKLLAIALVLIFSGCIKTAEQVRRENQIDSMSKQMSDSQSLVADLTSTLKETQNRLNHVTGQMEELEHRQKTLNAEEFKSLSNEIKLLKEQMSNLQSQNEKQKEEIQSQREFIEKVTKSLSGLKTQSSPTSSKKNTRETLKAADKLTRNKKYKDAKSLLESALEEEESPSEVNKIYYSLGINEYAQKNYDEGLVFFSKIFAKYPKSTLAPASLLHIGLSFKALGKKAEAKEAFQEVKNQYADSSEAKKAQKELTNL